jgi:hypothetical protein
MVARFNEACALANQNRVEDALRAYIGIFSREPEEELGWIGDAANAELGSLEGEVIDSEMIDVVEIFKIDCLRRLGKPDVAFQRLQDPFVRGALSRLESTSHMADCFHVRLLVADELSDVGMMEKLFAELMGFAIRVGNVETVIGVYNRRSQARFRLGLESELRELSPEDLISRADWGYGTPSDSGEVAVRLRAQKNRPRRPWPVHLALGRTAVSNPPRTSTALRVKALHVGKMLELIAARDNGPLLLRTGVADFPFEDAVVAPESLVAVSWKHVGESQIPGVEEPVMARQVLARSLEFARDFGASYLWMDVYCVLPAGVEVDAALEWMGRLYANATVYADWAADKEQTDAQTSGWIFQERMWTRLALRHSTLVEAVAKLIEYDYTVKDHGGDISKKNAEDLMDIARSAGRIIGSGLPADFLLHPWEFLARALVERGERHPLSDAVVDLQHRGTRFVMSAVLTLAEFVKEGRTKCRKGDGIVVFEPPQLSIGDVHKIISAISKTRLKYESDAPAAYFGVFNDRCGTDFSPGKLPGPRHLLGRLVDTRRFESNSTLAGAAVEMHVTALHGRVDFGVAEQTTFGYTTTEHYLKIGFCKREGIAVLALLDEENKSVSTAFGESYWHALSLMFVSQADALRLPIALQPRSEPLSELDIEAFVERLPTEVVA